MGTPHRMNTATLLPSGKVLIAGGCLDAFCNPRPVTELYDPASGKFSGAGSMTIPRNSHTATVLADGRVLIAGGGTTDANSPTSATAEVYQP